MKHYLDDAYENDFVHVVVSYVAGAVHEWGIVFRESDEGKHV